MSTKLIYSLSRSLRTWLETCSGETKGGAVSGCGGEDDLPRSSDSNLVSEAIVLAYVGFLEVRSR